MFTYKCGDLKYSDVAVVGHNAPLESYKNHPLSDTDVDADTIACVHLDSVWNNVVYDLQTKGNYVLSSTPEPSDFIGMYIQFVLVTYCEKQSCVHVHMVQVAVLMLDTLNAAIVFSAWENHQTVIVILSVMSYKIAAMI